ncbi:recombinase family protein, partial [Acetobacter pasteurianus]
RWLGHLCKRSFTNVFLNCKNGLRRSFVAVVPPKPGKTPVGGRLIGYARVSTDDQGTDAQLNELRDAGCTMIFEEHASGTDRNRPVLIRLLRDMNAGDTLVVVRLDRLMWTAV